MASLGSQKQLSIQQEDFLAFVLNGVRVPDSGATDKRKGDVDCERAELLIEAKYTGDLTNPAKSISVKLGDLEKITDEAYAAGGTPAYAFRITNPDSPIADQAGHVDWLAVPLQDFAYFLDLVVERRMENE